MTTTTETAASGKRPWTEDRRNDDGSTTVTMKRSCNGCGKLLGDVSDEEIEASVDGRPLPDVRGECPRCNGTTAADKNACGTCRSLAADGKPIEHEECARRAEIVPAPDHPDFEDLPDTLEERAALPARFHTPWFDNNGRPNAWLCAVCWDDWSVTQWPCATASKHGAQVFTR